MISDESAEGKQENGTPQKDQGAADRQDTGEHAAQEKTRSNGWALIVNGAVFLLLAAFLAMVQAKMNGKVGLEMYLRMSSSEIESLKMIITALHYAVLGIGGLGLILLSAGIIRLGTVK